MNVKSISVSFDGPLDIRYDPISTKILGYDVWRVVNGFRAFLYADKSAWVDIQPGFLTDGASIPKVFRNIYAAWSWYGQTAAMHDKLCETLVYMTKAGPVTMTRDECDNCFLSGLKYSGGSESDCNLLFSAVRGYALVTRTDKPSATPQKLALDAAWTIPA